MKMPLNQLAFSYMQQTVDDVVARLNSLGYDTKTLITNVGLRNASEMGGLVKTELGRTVFEVRISPTFPGVSKLDMDDCHALRKQYVDGINKELANRGVAPCRLSDLNEVSIRKLLKLHIPDLAENSPCEIAMCHKVRKRWENVDGLLSTVLIDTLKLSIGYEITVETHMMQIAYLPKVNS